MSRFIRLILIAAAVAILVAEAATAALDMARAGQVSATTITLIGATLSCFVVLIGIHLTQDSAAGPTNTCHNCGRRLWRTLRSLDRRPLLTCFACGSEWVLPSGTLPASVRPGI